MKTKILITGAGGYIGSVATYLFLQKGYEVVAIDNYSTGYRQPLEVLQKKFSKDSLRLYEADLENDLSPIPNQSRLKRDGTGSSSLDSIFEREKNISAVVHYAASCLVDESMKKPEKYFENNILGTLNLLKQMTQHKIEHIIFSSTCAVYGEAEYVPVDEKHPTKPNNPYGESKLMAEKIIEWFGRLKGVKYCILRYFNVAGSSDDGLIGDSKNPSTLLTQNAVRGILSIEPFYLTYAEVDTPDRSPIRDYTNVVDLNEAHLKALNYLFNGGKSEIINLGTGTGNSVLEIVNKVEEITGKQIEKKKATPRQGEYAKMIASVDKAKQILDWVPKRTIGNSVKSLIQWYKSHPQGWQK
ncbi:UDP-glucose 4-epimerase GalE [Candidatus Roizmanbacteria bacterium]|nr:UDP-glucose 4-epimerase GalE [Candidatus Roizmanbacteria bacterium]